MKFYRITSLIVLLIVVNCDNEFSGTNIATKGYVWMDKTDEGHYIIPVSIGTPPQDFKFLLDSHTARTIVFSSSLATKLSPYTKPFVEKDSSTFSWDKQFNLTFSDEIADIEYKGTRAEESITIDGISVPNQKFILGTGLEGKNNLPPMVDGLIGFGFRQGLMPIKYYDYESPIHKFLEKFSNEFTVFYNRFMENGSKRAGKITFGTRKDTENCDSEWISSNYTTYQRKYWSLNFDGWRLGAGNTNLGQTLYLDTDSDKPTVYIDAYNRMIKTWRLGKKDDGYYADCENLINFEPFKIYLHYPKVELSFKTERFFKKYDNDVCKLNVNSTEKEKEWYLTKEFHQDFCIHYNTKTRKIQFAKTKSHWYLNKTNNS